MCGITGFINSSRAAPRDELTAEVTAMADTLRHRGPDDGGAWADPRTGVALGHRRLSILDLSVEGHQPMISADGRYVIVFNGEIYNFAGIRTELEGLGHTFRGHCDTEVMLAAFVQWSPADALSRFNGMFAYALWDQKEQELHLVRDRLGKKPLYYGWMGDTFLFGSELKALRAHHRFEKRIDRGALSLFLRHNYVPSPYSIYEGISKLPPGTMFTLRAGEDKNFRPGRTPDPVAYWSARQVAETGAARPYGGTEDEALEELDSLLRESVRLRMVADVPLGAFLSGGIDSSLVAALMQAQSDRPVKTFTIGFWEKGYNEAEYAKDVASHLGTEHTELYVTPEQALAVIPRLPSIYDEPFSDSSQIPTFLVSEMARKHVTVSLSGDGGDELFAGYTRYQSARRLWAKVSGVPLAPRRAIGRTLLGMKEETLDVAFSWLSPLLRRYGRSGPLGIKLHGLGATLSASRPEDMYLRLTSHWKNPGSIVIGGSEPPVGVTDPNSFAALPSVVETMMYLDLISYLPDDILVKVDRASMAVSLETRGPLLDYRVAEFAWKLPMSMKMGSGDGKLLLRRLLGKYVPVELTERPKMGFGVPIDSWLRGPLRDWAEALLDEDRLRREGFFHADMIRRRWRQHLDGIQDWHYYLWDVLMFQAWFEENG